MIKLGTAPNTALALALSLAAAFACGGDEGGSPEDKELGDGNQLASSGGTGGSSSSVTLPEVCQRQSECPSGYVCVPPAESFTQAVDPVCYDACSNVCTQAGPFAETCQQDCTVNCTGDVPPPEGSLNGKCFTDPEQPGGSAGSGNTQPGNGGTGGSTSNPGPAIQWANTWTVDVEYTADCNWANNADNSATQKYTVTMQVTGSNSSPKATLSGGYELEGTGGDDRMTLTGDFPLRSWKGETATTHTLNSPNEATIRITTVVSANEATGTIEGQWDASAGWKCTANEGKIKLTR